MITSKLVPASQTGHIQAMPLRRGLVNLTSSDGAKSNINIIDCLEEGEVTIVWDEGSIDDVLFLIGMQKAVQDVKTVAVKSGKFHFG